MIKGTQTIYKHLNGECGMGWKKKIFKFWKKKKLKVLSLISDAKAAILCNKDASVDYGEITQYLAMDAFKNKVDQIMQFKGY